MTQPTPTRELRDRLQTLLDEAVEALSDACTPVSSQTIEPGTPSWDYCCCSDEDVLEDRTCGHAYIRVIRINMVDPFPNQTLEPTNCNNLGALVELGVLRCAPTLDEQGNAPAPEEITTTANLVYSDAATVHNVLAGHEPDYANFPVVLDTWLPLEPEGGCTGGAWTFWIDIDLCAPTCSPGESV